MTEIKKILVFPDFCSSGIWDGNDKHHTMVEYEELGLSIKLTKDFRDWIEMYDRGSKRNYSGLKKKSVLPIYREGLRLAREIKALFPGSSVEYWAEMERCSLKKMKIFCMLKGKVRKDGSITPLRIASRRRLPKSFIPESFKNILKIDQKTGKLVPINRKSCLRGSLLLRDIQRALPT